MSLSGGTTQNISQTGPAPFQQPYVDSLLSESKRLYNQGGPKLYEGGPWTAGFTPVEQQAQQGVINSTPQVLDMTKAGSDAYRYNLTAGRDPMSNPFLAGAVEAAIRPVFEQLTENALPQIRQNAVVRGGFGGTRQGVAEGIATGKATQAALDTSSRMYSDAFNFGNQQALQTLSMTPQLVQSSYAPYAALGEVGAQQRAYNQALLDQVRNTYEYNQQLPYQNLQEYSNYVRLPFGGYGQSASVGGTPGTAAQVGGLAASLLPLLGQLIKLF